MDSRPIRNHPFIPPLLIGLFSLFGLCTILALAFFPEQNAEIDPTRTLTPFKYQFLATETLTAAATSETTEPAQTSETAELRVLPSEASTVSTVTMTNTTNQGIEPTPRLVTTEQNRSATAPAFTATPTMTLQPVFGNSEPLPIGKFDDRDPRFTYIGVWNREDNSYAYQETVLISEQVGDYVAFRFNGLQLMIGYQSTDDAGEFTVNVDGLEETMSQLAGSIWFSDYLEAGTHSVIITHTGPGPVNLDFVEVAE